VGALRLPAGRMNDGRDRRHDERYTP
jgi:hypothetical protein